MSDDFPRAPLELWAGFECTLNRVGDTQHDQLELVGHYGRLHDLDRLAELGVRTVRYPILWERIESGRPNGQPWEWTDARMQHMRALGIEPIVGLVHHGSGPFGTSLLDAGFADGLAQFARTVAERYPWVTRYTPVNEPLTTARFSALYGVWYPHARDDALFLRATLNQVRATRLAMQAIRAVTPAALLVQTEDLGRTHATPALRYQAAFENERRWLTFDLLTDRVRPGHAIHRYALNRGITDQEIAHAVGDGCAPDIIGINHYATSERFLDERVDRYPEHTHGGNGRHRYADVEAVRVLTDGVSGPHALIAEAWKRYGIPIAVTEAHLGCTREQQMRWLAEVWDAARGARDAGADVRAVTAWAALGTRDWSSLVTCLEGHYEPGLFDVRAREPRPTALARMAGALATTGRYDHPALGRPGWWRCADRVLYPEHDDGPRDVADAGAGDAPGGRPVLITGATGTLGSAFARLCDARGLAFHALSRHALDIRDQDAVERVVRESGAWAVINAAGYVRVDDAERDASACRRLNTSGPATLADVCAALGIPLVAFSSDLVFDGRKRSPYVESDRVAPLGVYGRTKAECEARVLGLHPSALVIRTAAFFGPWDEWNFLTRTLASLALGVPVDAADDLIVSPTYVPDLVHATLDLLIDGEHGIWHLASAGEISWAELARTAARAADLDETLVCGRPHTELGLTAARPGYAALGSERGHILPPLEAALGAYVREQPWRRGFLDDDTLAMSALDSRAD
ncbi:MAG: dTDP-4-dehydrorhamnose reductase [Gemmatimonadetes bacterium]|nr:dTDP-4-dehydrorhamnose reductase [Gemmatimonadota bacterium]